MKYIFESKRIGFAEISEDNIDDYLKMVNDIDGVARFISKKMTPYSVDEEKAFVQSKLVVDAPIYSMFDKETNEFIGNIEFMDMKDECAELGIAITASKQNLHLGSEAIERMVEYGFETMKLNRIMLRAFPFNKRAIHVYEKSGFVKYGETEDDVLMEINRV